MKEYQVPKEKILWLASKYDDLFEVVQEQLKQGIDPNLKTFPKRFSDLYMKQQPTVIQTLLNF